MLLLLGALASGAQGRKSAPKADSLARAVPAVSDSVVTEGSVTVEGKRLDYRAVAGTLTLRDDHDKPTCRLFYVAYFRKGETPASRPLTFLYNGGPGSATLWLHMGAWGPQRVRLSDTSRTVAPFSTVNNDYSLLDASDLVFIDAPGTGFSEVLTKDKGGAGDPKDFYGIDQDGRAFADFITRFLTTFDRWDSPKYLFGESYGTFRSAVVANLLETGKGVALNGVILLSQLLSYENMSDVAGLNPGMDLPYELALPSMAATAWYHHKLPGSYPGLEALVKEVEDFALGDYALALSKGALLDSATFQRIAEKLHDYTGLPVDYIRKANLRVSGPRFEHALLNDEDRVTGRLDTRFSGFAYNPLGETPRYDPMESTIESAFVSTYNTYVHTVLGYGKGQTAQAFSGAIGQWDFRHRAPGASIAIFPNVMGDLASAMIYDPHLKVMLNMGYYDLGTPFFEALYEMHHLPMPVALQKNIQYAFYQSGHMVYLHPDALKQLHDRVAAFIAGTGAGR